MKHANLKPYCKKELCSLYGITNHVFRIWLKTIDSEIGKAQCGIFNIKQVETIFLKFGTPIIETTNI